MVTYAIWPLMQYGHLCNSVACAIWSPMQYGHLCSFCGYIAANLSISALACQQNAQGTQYGHMNNMDTTPCMLNYVRQPPDVRIGFMLNGLSLCSTD